MSRTSSSRVIQGLIRLRYNRVNPSTATRSTPSRLSSPSSSNFRSHGFSQFNSELTFHSLSFKPAPAHMCLSQIGSCPKHNFSDLAPKGLALIKPRVCLNSPTGSRFFSLKSPGSGQKVGGGFREKIVNKPVNAVTSAFSKYREAIGLHADAFWRRNQLAVFGAGAVLVCALLWRVMFGIASSFVSLSEGMAKYGFLALSTAIVAFAGLYIRSKFIINPDKVYRMTMRRLNTAAEILEVMGAPLSGSDLRAYVMSGGGVTFKKFKPAYRSKRCFLIFPIRGSERKGLVSVEVKKKKGQYDMKLLAVDIPMASGPDQRLFLIGDEEEYKVGGGLISELRDPVVRAMAATKEFDDLDRIEEEEDAEKELEEAERKHREEMEKLEKEKDAS